jgi:predicted DNA binding CopG/RHH family protein
MKKRKSKVMQTDAEYYDSRGVLSEVIEEDVDIGLEDALREDILSGKRRRRLQNVSIKLDPLYLQSIKRIATSKGIPYQSLLRLWLVEMVRKELKIEHPM